MRINASTVDKVVKEIIDNSSTNIHFLNIHSNIVNKPNIFKAFRNMMAGVQIDMQETDYLKMVGITCDGRTYRNFIYESVFGPLGSLSLFETRFTPSKIHLKFTFDSIRKFWRRH